MLLARVAHLEKILGVKRLPPGKYKAKVLEVKEKAGQIQMTFKLNPKQ